MGRRSIFIYQGIWTKTTNYQTISFFENPKVRKSRGKAVPLQRLGSADDIANTVLFLASEEASYINANEIVVDGGVIHSVLMHLPRD